MQQMLVHCPSNSTCVDQPCTITLGLKQYRIIYDKYLADIVSAKIGNNLLVFQDLGQPFPAEILYWHCYNLVQL